VSALTTVDGYGGYVPLYRIERDDVAAQQGSSDRGETAVPNADENNITMASEAASIALERSAVEGKDLGAVFSASTSDPYAELGIAPHVAYRHGATGDVRTGDFAGSPRAATDALATANSFVESTESPALVVSVDIIPAYPGDDEVATSGAGAAAMVLRPAAEDGAAVLEDVDAVTTGFVERHRRQESGAVSGDPRFETVHGFGDVAAPGLEAAVSGAEPDRAVVASPVRRIVGNIMDTIPGEPTQETTFDDVGYAGAASFMLDLVDQIESGSADEQLVGVNYGPGGLDVLHLTLSEGATDEPGMTVAEHIAAKEYVTYAKHIEYREQRDYGSESL
jgi:3-hydroxy-3-methylglutaryl CoA synthase